VIIFGSIQFLYKKKVTKPGFFKKTKIEPELVQTDRFQFSYFRKKNRFKLGWLGFFGLAWFFSGLARFFFGFFGLGSIRFFRFQAYKTETKPVDFFKILIGFFFTVRFFCYFFPVFLIKSVFQFFCSPIINIDGFYLKYCRFNYCYYIMK